MSLWRALARPVAARMRRRRPALRRALPPVEALHVAAQTAPSKVMTPIRHHLKSSKLYFHFKLL